MQLRIAGFDPGSDLAFDFNFDVSFFDATPSPKHLAHRPIGSFGIMRGCAGFKNTPSRPNGWPDELVHKSRLTKPRVRDDRHYFPMTPLDAPHGPGQGLHLGIAADEGCHPLRRPYLPTGLSGDAAEQ